MKHAEAVEPKLEKPATFKLAQRVFDLMGQWNTPPYPSAYAVWYAYVSKSNNKLVERVDEILESNGEIGQFDIDELYNAYLVEENAEDVIRRQIEKEVTGALQAIEESISTNDSYRTTLNQFDEKLPAARSPEMIRSIVHDLIIENKRMSDQTRGMADSLRQTQKQIESLEEELAELSEENMRDPLTGIANRRGFDRRLIEEMELASKASSNLCLVLADLDHFKRINDRFGHPAGDAVLRLCGSVLSSNSKRQDLVARYGGEEFAMILPRTPLNSACDFVDMIRQKIERLRVVNKRTDETIDSITCSFGVFEYQKGMTVDAFIAEADKQLYAAKAGGRNQVCAPGLRADPYTVKAG